MHLLQAPPMAYLRPGQWMQWLFGCTPVGNWHREVWVVRAATGIDLNAGDVLNLLKGCTRLKEQVTHSEHPAIKAADFLVRRCTVSEFVCYFFTHNKQWLDVCEVTPITEDGSAAMMPSMQLHAVRFSAYSFSASIVPLSSPFALLLAPILWFLPFADMGQNKIHLRTLRQLLTDEGLTVTVV